MSCHRRPLQSQSESTLHPSDTRVQTLTLGRSRRAQVRVLDGESQGTVAWLSLRTSFMEMLVGPIKFDHNWVFWNLPKSILTGKQSVYQEYEIGALLQTVLPVTVYDVESLSANVLSTLPPGSPVRVLGIGVNHPFRCKIASVKKKTEGVIGWVDGKTKSMDDAFGYFGGKGGFSHDKLLSAGQKHDTRELFAAARAGNIERLRELLKHLAGVYAYERGTYSPADHSYVLAIQKRRTHTL